MRKIIGWYVVNPKGERCAWAHSRATARMLASKLARDFPADGPFWTVAEYAEAA